MVPLTVYLLLDGLILQAKLMVLLMIVEISMIQQSRRVGFYLYKCMRLHKIRGNSLILNYITIGQVIKTLFLIPFVILTACAQDGSIITSRNHPTIPVGGGSGNPPPNYASVIYCSPWGGGDTLTYSEIKSMSYQGGDTILFLKGYTYKDTTCWRIRRNGADTNRIYIGAYGTGLKPIITSRYTISNSDNTNAWNTTAYTNVWKMTYAMPSGYSEPYFNISRMWFDDVEYGEANGLTGDNEDGTGNGINSTNRFWNKGGVDYPTSHEFYVYATSNPATFYSTIESLSPPYHNSDVTAIIQSPYVTIDGLDYRGGEYTCLGLVNADHSWIINCNVGRDAGWMGINVGRMNTWGVFGEVAKTRSDSVVIANDTLDSGFRLNRIWYDNGTENGRGINIDDSVYYADIYNNYIKDWMINISHEGLSYYNQAHNNEVTNPDGSYGKPFQLAGRGQNATADQIYFRVYNNYIHDCKYPSQIIGSYIYFYFNIIADITQGTNAHASNHLGTLGVQMIDGANYYTGDNVFIFNNTFNNLDGLVFNGLQNGYNNLLIDYHKSVTTADRTFLSQSSNGGTNINNLLYVPGQDAASYVFRNYTTGISYNLAAFNALSGKSGNLAHYGSEGDLINANFTLPVGSEAIGAAFDVSALLPVGFTDRNGNPFNGDIGGIQTP